MTDALPFPSGFLWGTATSAHQVEGGNAGNDWWDWEQAPGRVRNGHTSRVACDWWNRAEEDFALAARLGTNALRLSIEWSRVEPEEGRFDDAALDRYRRMLERLRAVGLEPMVCLHHFTLPRWLARKGGFEQEVAVERFTRFAARVAREYADLVRHWLTVNEPMVFVAMGWFDGRWPPGKKSLPAALRVARNLVRAHAAAYREIHRWIPGALVSAANHLARAVPHDPRSRLDRGVAALRAWLTNEVWLRAATDGILRPPLGRFDRVPGAEGSHDFIGVQHYFTYPLEFSLCAAPNLFARERQRRQPGAPDFMGEPRPEDIGVSVGWARRFGRPIVITENGLLENEERERPAYLLRTLGALHRAIRDGADVRGYFHWSLVDNFEWAEGYDARFGLVAVDLETQRRTVKRSGHLYGEIARANAITRAMARSVDPALEAELFDAPARP